MLVVNFIHLYCIKKGNNWIPAFLTSVLLLWANVSVFSASVGVSSPQILLKNLILPHPYVNDTVSHHEKTKL